MRTALLIYNPRAGAERPDDGRERVTANLKEGGFGVEAVATRAAGDATRLAREAAESGVEVVFSLGGDGTLREVAAGLLGSDTLLAPLPGGTTNVVARSLGVATQPDAAALQLARGRRGEMDVGLCGGEPFLMQASAGLDATVMAKVDPILKRRIGKLAVGLAGLRVWWSYSYPPLVVRTAGGRRACGFVAFCNLPLYGGSFQLAPAARPADGRLQLVALRSVGRFTTLGFARDVLLGRHLGRKDVEVEELEEAVLEGPDDLPLQVDGDSVTLAPPVEIRLAERRLAVLLPS